jgi:CRISPR-associated protein Cas6
VRFVAQASVAIDGDLLHTVLPFDCRRNPVLFVVSSLETQESRPLILWQDDPPTRHSTSSAIDLVFRIDCRQLPVDHASALADAIVTLAPWLREVAEAAIQPVHLAGSQNGWERPVDGSGDDLLLSKRTRLIIRVPDEHSATLQQALCGQTIQVDGNPMTIISARARALQGVATLLARHVVYHELGEHNDEQTFTDAVVQSCLALGFQPSKLLCGLRQQLKLAGRTVTTRSVMLADVPTQQSLQLQQHGLGDERLIGCGVLIPNKDIAAVNQAE